MVTGDLPTQPRRAVRPPTPPAQAPSPPAQPRRPVWPWAVGTIVVTLAVIAATLVGHRLVARARLAAQVASPPSAPVMRVVSAIRASPNPGTLCDTLDTPAHTLIAYRGPSATCAGVASPSVSGQPTLLLALYDSVSGQMRSILTIPTQGSPAFVVSDDAHGQVYIAQVNRVTILDATSGKVVGSYASNLGQHAVAMALDPATGALYVVASDGSARAVDAATGAALASSPTAPGPTGLLPTPTGMALDTTAGLLYTYAPRVAPAQPNVMIQAYHLADLSPAGAVMLPTNWQPGPYNAAEGTLYCFGPGGAVGAVRLPRAVASQSRQTVQPAPVAALRGASRIGWDTAGGLLLRMGAQNTDLLRASDGQVVARAPYVGAAAKDTQPIAVDTARGLAYVNDGAGDILITSLTPMKGTAAPNAATALVMARAGLASLLPNTNQSPPFLSAQTFPLSPGAIDRQYFIHYADLGWKGPYSGSASVTDVRAGSQPGDYTMTFAVTWNQLFLHQHSWQVELTPDGRAHLRAESGDAIP